MFGPKTTKTNSCGFCGTGYVNICQYHAWHATTNLTINLWIRSIRSCERTTTSIYINPNQSFPSNDFVSNFPLVSHWKIPWISRTGFRCRHDSDRFRDLVHRQCGASERGRSLAVPTPSQLFLLHGTCFVAGLAGGLVTWQMWIWWNIVRIDVVLVWCSLLLTVWCVLRCFTICFMRLLCRTFRWPLLFSSKDFHPQLRLLHLFRATLRWSGLGILVFHRVLVGGEHQSAHPYLTDRGGHHSLFVSLECHLVTLDTSRHFNKHFNTSSTHV